MKKLVTNYFSLSNPTPKYPIKFFIIIIYEITYRRMF